MNNHTFSNGNDWESSKNTCFSNRQESFSQKGDSLQKCSHKVQIRVKTMIPRAMSSQ